MMSLRLAFGFLTILPVSPREQAAMGPSRAYFPLGGLTLGGALAGIDWLAAQALSSLAVNAILVTALLVLTRAIHSDGFLDACDGLFGGKTREDRLRIMRDSRAGSFAVLGGASLVLLKWSLLVGLPEDLRVPMLALFPCLSRLGMLAAMEVFPYARDAGLGTAFLEGRSRWQIAFGLATGVLAAGLLLNVGGLVLVGGAVAVSLAFGWWMSRMLGGMTGDTYGAVNELAEVGALAFGIVLFSRWPGVFQAPFW